MLAPCLLPAETGRRCRRRKRGAGGIGWSRGGDDPQPIMSKTRLEAFSDGVIAIIITIMVLELRVPHGAELASLRPLVPVAGSYVLSFVYLGIYWNNHHHMLQVTRRVSGGVLWANLHLLFWLSLIPFVTAWMGENHFAPVPTAAYGVVLLLAAAAYTVLQGTIITAEGRESVLAAAVGGDGKGKLSIALYAIAIPAALVWPWVAGALYAGVAVMWLVPDRRIERVVIGSSDPAAGHHAGRRAAEPIAASDVSPEGGCSSGSAHG
jgi:uncharacterized membrane protein